MMCAYSNCKYTSTKFRLYVLLLVNRASKIAMIPETWRAHNSRY